MVKKIENDKEFFETIAYIADEAHMIAVGVSPQFPKYTELLYELLNRAYKLRIGKELTLLTGHIYSHISNKVLLEDVAEMNEFYKINSPYLVEKVENLIEYCNIE